jgi:hypothetical protein
MVPHGELLNTKSLKRYFSYFIYSVLFSVQLILPGCDNPVTTDDIPLVFVSEDINLNHLQYQDLQKNNGYIYFDAGFRGLIIRNEGGGSYRVFERACTLDAQSECDPVTMHDSGLFMQHVCCGSTFNLQGEPTGGPAAVRLREYTAITDGIYLLIRSDL